MPTLVPQFVFLFSLALLLVLLMGWYIWGNLKKQARTVETHCSGRYGALNDDYPYSSDNTSLINSESHSKVTHTISLQNELDSARNQVKLLESNRDELQQKLDDAIQYVNKNNSHINNDTAKLTEIRQLKVMLGKATERSNQLNITLQKKENVIKIKNIFSNLAGTVIVSEINNKKAEVHEL